MYQIVSGYRQDDALRKSFDELAQRTFGISFENWYQRGFWTDRYEPWSVAADGRIIANVSVNRMNMRILGQEKRLIQLGTVMTDEAYRGRGLIRLLMERIFAEYADCDGIFLFANDTVLDFYPKFDFRRGVEHTWSKAVSFAGVQTMERVNMEDPHQWQRLKAAMEQSKFCSGCDMLENPGLPFFYIFAELGDCVYYSRELDAWAIAPRVGEMLHIYSILSPKPVSIDAVAAAFGSGFDRVELGFAPEDPSGWDRRILQEKNSTFFVRGALFEDFEANALRIPVLARA